MPPKIFKPKFQICFTRYLQYNTTLQPSLKYQLSLCLPTAKKLLPKPLLWNVQYSGTPVSYALPLLIAEAFSKEKRILLPHCSSSVQFRPRRNVVILHHNYGARRQVRDRNQRPDNQMSRLFRLLQGTKFPFLPATR